MRNTLPGARHMLTELVVLGVTLSLQRVDALECQTHERHVEQVVIRHDPCLGCLLVCAYMHMVITYIHISLCISAVSI